MSKTNLGEMAAAPTELPPKIPMSVERRLRTVISGCLGAPRGDPDRHHMLAAAHAFLALRDLECSVSPDDEDFLRHNNYKLDFIDLAERDVHL